MSSSISLEWSRCFVMQRGSGWFRLCGVPGLYMAATALRLLGLGAVEVVQLDHSTVQFRCNSATVVGVIGPLVQAFPTCPLAR